MGFRVGRLFVRLAEIRRTVRTMAGIARTEGDCSVVVVKSPTPISMVAGVLRPQVILSTHLLHSLSGRMLKAVLAHEQAHVRRRHGLLSLIAAVVTTVHLPWTRRQLMDDLHLACEQVCDEDAAVRVGDRLTVADTIVAVSRAVALRPPLAFLATPGFCEHAVEVRMYHLLGERLPVTRSAGVSWSLVVIFAAAIPFAAGPAHLVLEAGLRLLAH